MGRRTEVTIMPTPIGAKRTEPRKPLKRGTPIKRTKGLSKMSQRAKAELVIWRKVKTEREALIREKLGWLPCEWCGFAIQGEYDGHHNDHNRRNNVVGNARLLHRSCHTFVEDNNVKDVPSLL